MSQQQEARRIVREIWENGIRGTSFDDPRDSGFAFAALSELIALREEIPGIFEEVLEGTELGANQLAVEDTHGLMELVQNADDQRASRIRFGVRQKSGRSQLVVVHNGDPIMVDDALAMCFAFVSTKRDDPKMTGKFGIGLKTLSRLADRFEVHCRPYNFAIAGNRFEILPKPRRSKIYDPQSNDTMLVLPLKREDAVPRIKQWIEMWNARNMLFLNHLRELSWVHLPSGKVGVARRLTERKTGRRIPWQESRSKISITETILNDRAQDQQWIRYDAEIPVPKKLSRAFKETGETTTVSVALPSHEDTNVLYAGLPTRIALNLPYSICAAFDPNTSRTEVQQNDWNRWLWKRISGLLSTLCLHLLKETPARAWKVIPASDETSVPVDNWLEEQIDHLRTDVYETVRRRGKITTTEGIRRLSQISYEEEFLDGLLTSEDFLTLAPSHMPLPTAARDSEGRWRKILIDLEIGKCIEVAKALDLLPLCAQQPLTRSPEWYVRLICEALDGDMKWRLNDLPCVLVVEPVELLTPNTSVSLFSAEDAIEPLASRLGLVRRLHGSLLGQGHRQKQLREWLKESELLWQSSDATTVLEAIARQSTGSPLELSDRDLVELRGLIDDIQEPDYELLLRVGESVVIDAYQWVQKKRVYCKATVNAVYLPPSMSEADGWPKVAGSTPGLKWAAPRYATLLDPKDRQSGKSGARRLLASLGASNLFRLVHWPSRMVGSTALPTLQLKDFEEFQHRPRELRDDYMSPDLESVVQDICRASRKERYDRGLDLLRLLDRHWRRTLQPKSFCTAIYYRDLRYSGQTLGEVGATWTARLAEHPWLYNEERRPARPLDLTIRSPLTQNLYGNAKQRFAAGIQDDLAPGLVAALGFEKRPKASDIVDVLVSLRGSGESIGWNHVRSHYAYLDSLCPDSSIPASPKERIDDMTVGELRGRFGINPKAQGLLAIDGGWKAPTAVLKGRRIFGDRRSFVRPGFEKLWHALGIREPNISDCVSVLKEIVSDGDPESDASILTDTLRHIDTLLGASTGKDLRGLVSLPLWSGATWETQRPIYYISDESAAQSLAATHTVWRPPCSLEELDALVGALNVTWVPLENCTPTGIKPGSVSAGIEFREQYSLAVETLKDFLAKNQPKAYRDMNVEWSTLSEAAIIVAPRLSLAISLPTGVQVHAETNAYIAHDPMVLYIQHENLLYDYGAGARVISQCFGSMDHRQIVRLAWSNPNVLNQVPSSALTLAVDSPPEEDPLESLKSIVDMNVGKVIGGRRTVQPPSSKKVEPKPIEPRRLKSIDSISVREAEIVNRDARSGRQLPEPRAIPVPPNPYGPAVGTRPSEGIAPANYTSDEREQLALRVLERIVGDNKGKLKDFTRLKGLGADAGDSIGHLFEVKAHAGEMPDSVNIELSQRRAAIESPEKFYLAVVSGLEEGDDDIVVKLFDQPMRTLDLEKGTSIKLSGIRSKRALEVRLGSE